MLGPRLGDELVNTAAADLRDNRSKIDTAGQQYAVACRVRCSYFIQEFRPFDFRHALIADNDISGLLGEQAARLTESRRCAYVIFAAERLFKETQTGGLVVKIKDCSFQLHTLILILNAVSGCAT